MKKLILFFCLILLIANLSAQCSESQININTASATDLDKLSGIGTVYAQRIIDLRPFSSVDDLIKVNGIGNVTLGKIKQQGLACVEGNSNSESTEQKKETSNNSEQKIIPEQNEITYEESAKKEIKTIDLTQNSVENNSQKDIKTADSKEKLNKYAIYGLAGFCILIGVLLLNKNNKKRKNEFKRN